MGASTMNEAYEFPTALAGHLAGSESVSGTSMGRQRDVLTLHAPFTYGEENWSASGRQGVSHSHIVGLWARLAFACRLS